MTSLSINPVMYLWYLQSQLLALRTTFIRRRLSHIAEAFTLMSPPADAVVNATGLLALKLGGVEDLNLYPTRGQTILVTNECSRMYSRSKSLEEEGENWMYIIPRPYGGGTVLGGCRQDGNW